MGAGWTDRLVGAYGTIRKIRAVVTPSALNSAPSVAGTARGPDATALLANATELKRTQVNRRLLSALKAPPMVPDSSSPGTRQGLRQWTKPSFHVPVAKCCCYCPVLEQPAHLLLLGRFRSLHPSQEAMHLQSQGGGRGLPCTPASRFSAASAFISHGIELTRCVQKPN